MVILAYPSGYTACGANWARTKIGQVGNCGDNGGFGCEERFRLLVIEREELGHSGHHRG